MTRPAARLLAVVLLATAGCTSSPPYPDERVVCSGVQEVVDARAAGDPVAEERAMARLRRASQRSQNITLARYGQAFSRVPGVAPDPLAFDRLIKECLRLSLPLRGVRVPF